MHQDLANTFIQAVPTPWHKICVELRHSSNSMSFKVYVVDQEGKSIEHRNLLSGREKIDFRNNVVKPLYESYKSKNGFGFSRVSIVIDQEGAVTFDIHTEDRLIQTVVENISLLIPDGVDEVEAKISFNKYGRPKSTFKTLRPVQSDLDEGALHITPLGSFDTTTNAVCDLWEIHDPKLANLQLTVDRQGKFQLDLKYRE